MSFSFECRAFSCDSGDVLATPVKSPWVLPVTASQELCHYSLSMKQLQDLAADDVIATVCFSRTDYSYGLKKHVWKDVQYGAFSSQ